MKPESQLTQKPFHALKFRDIYATKNNEVNNPKQEDIMTTANEEKKTKKKTVRTQAVLKPLIREGMRLVAQEGYSHTAAAAIVGLTQGTLSRNIRNKRYRPNKAPHRKTTPETVNRPVIENHGVKQEFLRLQIKNEILMELLTAKTNLGA